jgi:hypothetical protein
MDMEDDMIGQLRGRVVRPAVACLGSVLCLAPAVAQDSSSVALLGIHFQNDNEVYEPTSTAERERLVQLGVVFKKELEDSGRFDVKQLPDALASQISAGQTLGECGGCELDYGAKLGVDQVAWINVQKVSNLILNLNVYMADVQDGKMTFVRSVDIRGNTDESWRRSLIYLVKNYLLPGLKAPGT